MMNFMTGEEGWIGPGPGRGRLSWPTGRRAGGRSTSSSLSFVICLHKIIHSLRHYILCVQLHTVCVGLPTHSIQSSHFHTPCRQFHTCQNSFTQPPVVTNISLMLTGAGDPIHPEVDDLRQSQSESCLFLLWHIILLIFCVLANINYDLFH